MRTRTFLLSFLLVALFVGGAASYYASSAPDGLNKVAEDQGFADSEAESAAADSPLAGYETRGIENERLSGGLAGVTGVVVCFLVGSAIALAVRRRDGATAGREAAGDGDRAGTAAQR